MSGLTPGFLAYMAAWISACLAAAIVYSLGGRRFVISQADYWRWLAAPWKLFTFAVATLGIVFIAPYTGDGTWDYVDAFFMSALTFATAPWATGVAYRSLRGHGGVAEAYVAACAWLFSASWSYDLYLVWRDGGYPGTWLSNIGASSTLYVAAGMMWNLEWRPGRGVVFGFMLDDWPAPHAAGGLKRVFWYALPLMLFAAIAILSFVFPGLSN